MNKIPNGDMSSTTFMDNENKVVTYLIRRVPEANWPDDVFQYYQDNREKFTKVENRIKLDELNSEPTSW